MVFKKIWSDYKDFAERACGKTGQNEVKDINYWRTKIYIVFSIYFIPFSFLALIPGVWMSLQEKMYFVAFSDLIAAFIITVVIFNKRISLTFKKVFIVAVLYLLALMLLSTLGLFGPGIIYLYALTVFTAVMISSSLAFWSVALHVVTCTFFGLLIYFQPGNSKLFSQHSLGSWIAFSSNLIFLSTLSVFLISKFINGLEQTIVNEAVLIKSLQIETENKDSLNRQLKESESYFKNLFMLNPLPMCVFDSETFKILEVNDAAIKGYGYSKHEFLKLNMADIKPTNDLASFKNTINQIIENGTIYESIATHRDKKNNLFPVDIRYSVIFYHGKKALLGIAKNISDQINYTNAIKSQNQKLRKIGYIQSHLVRGPLARIMGLVDLMIADHNDEQKALMLNYLSESANELDEVIKRIINKTDDFKDVETLISRKEEDIE
jgi:PAS domain S-box-containing protein